MSRSGTSSPGNALHSVHAVFSSFVRLVVLGYTALAIFTFFEIRALLLKSKDGNSFEIDDGTLFVPLVLCFPSTLEVDGFVIVDSTNTTSPAFVEQVECRQLDYLMSACAASLLFAAAACVLFVFCDFLARIRCCPFDLNSSSGMAIFLTFILVQAGISIGALAEQNHFWVEHFKEVIKERDLDLEVESYAHSIFLIGSALSSFGVAFLVLLDATCSRCCHRQDIGRRSHEEDDKEETGIFGWMRQGKHIEDTMQKGQEEEMTRIPSPEENLDEDQRSTVAASSGRSTGTIPPWCKV
jgi:hypothetical protein